MKKVTFIMALAAAAGLASCTAQSPKANLKTDVDSLSYAIGMARTEGLDQYLAQQGIDSTQMTDFLKGFNEGASKIDKKDVAYMAGLQIGQMVSKQWVEGFNQQIFGGDSTQTISRENLLAGFVAGVVGKGIMTKEEAQTFMQTQMDAVKAKAMEKKYADNKAAGEKFLAENKTKEGVVTTPSGLQYKIITKGVISYDGKNYTLQMAEDINQIAFKTLHDRMLRELSNSLLRVGIKQGLKYAASKQNEWLGLAVSLTNAITEKADTRNWQTLPYSISYARVPLQASENNIELKFSGNHPGTQDLQKLTIPANGKRTRFFVYTTL